MTDNSIRLRWPRWDYGGLLIAAIYILAGGLWIASSDSLTHLIAHNDPDFITRVSLIKGYGYVLVTGVLLYLLIHLNSRNLRREHYNYLLLAENISDVVWVLDLQERRFTYISPSILQLRGMTPEEAMNEPLQQAMSPRSWEYLSSVLPARIAEFQGGTRNVYTDQLSQPRKNGSNIWIEVVSRFVLNPENDHLLVYAVSRDVTERKRVEDLLVQNERRFRTAFDDMLEGAQILSFDWRYVYLNPAAEVHNRRPNSELLGEVYMQMWPGIEFTEVFAQIRRCMEERIPGQMENRFVYPDGQVRWFELSFQPVVEGLLILSFDVTERVLAQRHSAQMTRLYATLSQVNQTIVRVKSHKQLFQSICDLGVEYGGFAMAWVGLLEEDTGDVRPVAANGLDVEHWPFPIVNISAGPSQNGVIATALRSSVVTTSEDVQVDERTRGLQPYIKDYDFHSLASVPFQLQGRTIGILNLISSETGHFKDEEELSLLEEMGMDISFALETMEKDRIRQQWADAFEHCGHGIAIGLPTGRLLTCNPAFARQHHASVEEISSMPIIDMYLPQDREQAEQYIQQADQQGHVQFEALKLRKDGSIFPAQVDLVSVRDANGSLLYRVATQQDVTERRQAEAELHRSQQLAQDTIDALADSLCVLDENATIIAVNRAWREFAEANPPVPENYAVGRNYLEVCDQAQGAAADEAAFFAVGLRALMRGEHDLFTFEYPCHVPHGERRYFSARALRFVAEGQMRMVVTHENVTARKLIEEELRASEERYRNLVENMNDLVMELDEQGNYYYISPNYEAFSGYSVQEEVGRPALVHVHPDDLPTLLEKLQMAQRSEQQQEATYRVQNRNGEWRWLEASGKPYRTVSGSLHLIVVARDVTERRQAEQVLRESEELFSKVFQASSSGINIIRISDQISMNANSAYLEIVGYPREEFVGHSAGELELFMDPSLRLKWVNSMRQNGMVQSQDVRIRRKSGEMRDLLISADRIDIHGEPMALVVANDITERRQAEEKLRLENERFLRFTDSNIVGITIAEASGKVILANDYYLNLLGVSRQDFLDKKVDWRTFTPPEWLPADEEALQQLEERGICDPYEKEYLRADGTRVSAYITVASLPGPNQELAAFVLDITERKQAEQKLRESEELFSKVFETSPSGLNIIRLTDQLSINANSAYLEIVGYPREEFVGYSAGNLNLFVDPDLRLSWLSTLRQGGTVQNQDVRIRRKSGEIRDLLVSVDRLDIQGEPMALVATTDITERKRAEADLRQSEENFSKAFMSSPSALMITRRADGTFMELNDALTHLFGYTREDLLGRQASQFNLYVDKGQRQELVSRLLANGSLHNYETTIRSKDGQHRSVLASLELINFDGEPCILSTLVDITERKQAEEKLRQSEENFSKAFLSSPSALMITRQSDGRFLELNDAYAVLVGYSREELLGRLTTDFNIFVNKEDRQEIVSRLFAEGFIHNFETVIRNRSGRLCNVLTSLELIHFSGEPSILSTLVDITERKEAEKIALESARQMQALVTSLDDIVFEIDEQGRYINVWTANDSLLLRPRDELLGAHLKEVMSEDLAHTFLEANARVLESGITEVIEYTLTFEAGQYWFAARINPIVVQEASLRSLSILVRDITERKQAEEKLRQSEAQYRYLFENNPHPMWAYDLKNLSFLAVNESAVARYGYSREEFLTMTIADIRPAEDVARLLDDVQSERPAFQHSEGWRHKLKDGTLIDVEISSHTLLLEDRNAALVVAQDVTERKQAERQIQRQLQRMSALTEIDRAINSSLDMRLSLDILLSEVLPQLKVHAAAILLLNTPMLTLECVAAKGFRSMGIRQARLRLGEGLAGQVGLERRMVHIPNLPLYRGHVKRADLFKGEGFVEYYGLPLIAKGTLKGVLEIFHRAPLDPDQDWINYLETLSGQAAIAIDNAQLFEGMQQSNLELITAYDATIAGWSHAMDLRDKETEGHTLRVTELTVRLADKMQLGQQDIIHLRRGALLHDIGKLGVPDHILLKPGPLTEEEWDIMRQHPAYAYNMLAPIIYLRPALDIPYCHHEKWDGSGYPRGLKADQIPLSARLFAIVDVWDALRSDRPYRARWSAEKTRQYLLEQSGRHFDPRVVEAFLSVIENEV